MTTGEQIVGRILGNDKGKVEPYETLQRKKTKCKDKEED
jgi:hypothetical protein